MKYILLIIAVATSLGLSSAQSATPKAKAQDCCNGGGCCGAHKACCKAPGH
jgi:hypothetical protein